MTYFSAIMRTQQLSKYRINKTQANGLNYAFLKEGEGEIVFFLHGFPDHAGSWDSVIDILSSDYTCIAPFLRGYYPTEIPSDQDYSVTSIARDIHQLALALGYEQYTVVGQDWGATVAYIMANLYPKHVKKVIALAMPHPKFLKPTVKLLFKARHILYFANKQKAINRLSRSNYHYLDTIYNRWSPQMEYLNLKQQMIGCFELEGRKSAALGYYWELGNKGKQKQSLRLYQQFPQVPTLVMVGKKDGVVDLSQFRKMERNSIFSVKYHYSAGHFLQREVPFYCALQIQDFVENPKEIALT